MPLGSLPAGALATSIGTAHAIAVWGLLGSAILGAVVGMQAIGAHRVRKIWSRRLANSA
jgi:hypothetical protein